jgi:hypothetical protein
MSKKVKVNQVVTPEVETVKTEVKTSTVSEVIKSKRFVMRKSIIGQGKIIEVTFKDGKVCKYNHDEVFAVMKEKLEAMACWAKYKTYTSSASMPVITRSLIIE